MLPLPVVRRVTEALSSFGAPFDEFTFEVNPEDIVQAGLSYVEGLLELGVNRFSMGVQSLDDGILRWMNRRHDAAGAKRAFRILRSAGAENISLDVIFGIAGFASDTLERTLDGLVSWGPEHISAYQLTVAEDSALGAMLRSGSYEELSDEACEEQYLTICRALSCAGFRHYEVSNWALPGREALHNSAYWRRLPYVGLGPAAHSFAILPDGTQRRSWNIPSATDGKGRSLREADTDYEILSPEDIRVETVMLALRTADGLPEARLRSLCGDDAVDEALAASLLERFFREEPSIRIPEEKFFISEAIIRDLL